MKMKENGYIYIYMHVAKKCHFYMVDVVNIFISTADLFFNFIFRDDTKEDVFIHQVNVLF